MKDAGREKRKQRSNGWRKSKEITAGCPHLSSSNPVFIHLFLPPSLPATPQSSTLQTAASMSNITRAKGAARALIISERQSEKILTILSASNPWERRRKGERRNGEYKAPFMFSLPCMKQSKMKNGLEVVSK